MFSFLQILTLPTRYRLVSVCEVRRRPCHNISKLLLAVRSIHRIFLSNALNFRESLTFIYRRLAEVYRTGRLSLLQERTFSRGHRFLLSACLISFAQDMITEEEMIQTAESFNISKCNKNLTQLSEHACRDCRENTVEESGMSQMQLDSSTLQSSQKIVISESNLSSLQGPITLYIREMRSVLARRKNDFLASLQSRVVALPVDAEVEINEVPASPPTRLSSLVECLSPDGTQFIDSTWEVVIERPDLRMWRRLCLRNIDASSNQGECLNSYEYRVCGTFDDISALCFLEVQLNLAYRRKWDSQVAFLEAIRPRIGITDQTEVIRWIAKFPFPMAKREYVYARRWWAEISHEKENTTDRLTKHDLALIISRAVSPAFANQVGKETDFPSVENDSNISWYSSLRTNLVTVREYESNMLIKSHGNFDEPGLDYFLTYYDDPQLSLSKETTSWLSSTFLPKLLDQLHVAAVTLSKSGFPVGISPVVMKLFTFSEPVHSEASLKKLSNDESCSLDSRENIATTVSGSIQATPSRNTFSADVQSNNSYQLLI